MYAGTVYKFKLPVYSTQHMTRTPAGTLYLWTSFFSLYRQDANFNLELYFSSALSSLPANLPPSRMLPNMAASNK